MDETSFELREILEIDQHNVNSSFTVLGFYGILPMYQRLSPLFKILHQEIQQHVSNLPGSVFTRTDSDGNQVPAWDLFLRNSMTVSAYEQFIMASGHLFRGHISQAFGHVRRAIEGAGIAFLSKSEPDLGDLFRRNDRKEFRKRTSTAKILPKTNPLTSALASTIDIASSQVHNNFSSLVSRMKESLTTKEGKNIYDTIFHFHEVDQEHLGYFLNIALWTLRAAERTSLLLSASFDIPEKDWHQTHRTFKEDLDRLYDALGTIILDKAS